MGVKRVQSYKECTWPRVKGLLKEIDKAAWNKYQSHRNWVLCSSMFHAGYSTMSNNVPECYIFFHTVRLFWHVSKFRESSGRFQKFLESFWVIENVPESPRKYWTLEDNFNSVMFEVVLKYSTRFRPIKVTSFSEIFSKLKTEVQNFHENSRMLRYFVVVDVEICSNSERFIV